MKMKYPIGLQSFAEIRKGNYLYIDKTEIIHSLTGSGKYFFLSRPRRFGKSLLMDTIEELFNGSRELFKGLWIENQWDWEETHPVIHISFSDIGVNTLGLAAAIFNALEMNAQKLGIVLTAQSYDQQFRELIEKASVKSNVVILIDEYDKPLIDFLDNTAKAEEHRAIMKNFYSVLKGADAHIRFLLITGVSRFSKVSIFSDLNNLNDITLSTRFGTIAGITQQELETGFAQEIAALQQNNPTILEKIREWYNGYSWDAKTRLYNPFSLLSFMAEPEIFRNYWFATGSPSFLVKLIKDKGEYNFDHIEIGEISLGNFDIAAPVTAPLLFQTGYLTIKSYDPESQTFELDYPNREVRASLLDGLLSAYREVFPGDSLALTGRLKKSLDGGDVEGVIRQLNAIISSIPYDHWRADTESIFNIIIFLTFKKVGVDVYTEVHSAKGRCDILVKTAGFIYVMELKLDRPAQEALDQALTTNYLQPYAANSQRKIAIGISFSSHEREVTGYEMKEL